MKICKKYGRQTFSRPDNHLSYKLLFFPQLRLLGLFRFVRVIKTQKMSRRHSHVQAYSGSLVNWPGRPGRAECETVANMAAQGAQNARQSPSSAPAGGRRRQRARQSQTGPPRAPRMRDSLPDPPRQGGEGARMRDSRKREGQHDQ